MAKYIVLVSWTEQGIKMVKDSPARAEKVRELGKGLGVHMEQLFLVMGDCDMVAVFDAPDDEAMAKLLLKVGAAGSVRTRTLKAFTEDEYRRIIAEL
jgi:uncharacterized protein with GYD domain